VLQCVAVCCSVLQCVAGSDVIGNMSAVNFSISEPVDLEIQGWVLQSVSECCSVLQCVAVFGSVL